MTFTCRELHDIITEIRSDFRQIQSRIYRPTQIRSKTKVVVAMIMMMLIWTAIMVMTAVRTAKMMTRLYIFEHSVFVTITRFDVAVGYAGMLHANTCAKGRIIMSDLLLPKYHCNTTLPL